MLSLCGILCSTLCIVSIVTCVRNAIHVKVVLEEDQLSTEQLGDVLLTSTPKPTQRFDRPGINFTVLVDVLSVGL